VSAKSKIIFAGVGCLAVALIALLPLLGRVHQLGLRPNCIFNLRQIEAAKQQWALEFHKSTNDVPTWDDLVGRGFLEKMPRCPQGGTYTIGRVGELPSCSIAEHTTYYRQNP
jgi:hypothetical protein